MQTDLIGYGDGMNMYTYVGNDPMNGVDPTGLMDDGPDPLDPPDCDADICVDGKRRQPIPFSRWGSFSTLEDLCQALDVLHGCGSLGLIDPADVIVVTGRRPGGRDPDDGPQREEPKEDPKPSDFCGSGWNSGLVPEYFGSECRAHDFCHGNQSMSRLGCDNKFRDDMLRNCSSRGSSPVCVGTAYIYYRFVRAFGDGPYNEGRRRPNQP